MPRGSLWFLVQLFHASLEAVGSVGDGRAVTRVMRTIPAAIAMGMLAEGLKGMLRGLAG
jgi:predicted benzoate:H+ symporter BenE